MKFPKGYLKSLKTEEEYERAFSQAMEDNLSSSSMRAVIMVASKKGIFLRKELMEISGIFI